jgi:hypothetical protein
MSDYLDRVERQLVQRADALYAPGGSGWSSAGRRGRFGHVPRGVPGLDGRGVFGQGGRLRRRGSWSVAGVVVGALGGLVAAVIMSLAPSPATSDFTVARGKGGVVTIKANTSSSISAVNSRLTWLGIPIRVARSLPKCTALGTGRGATRGSVATGSPDRPGTPVVVRRLRGDPRALLSVRVRPPTRPGQTLVLAADKPGGDIVGRLISGSAAVCAAGADRAPALLGAPG